MTHKTCACLLCLLLLAGGCVTASKTATRQAAPVVPAAPPMNYMNPEKLAPDIKLVVAAVIERLRGGTRPLVAVSFDPAGTHFVGEPDFRYEGFNVTGLLFNGFQVVESHPEWATARVEGTLVFKDGIDRCASVFFSALYTVTPKGVVINKSLALQLPPIRPYVELYIVQADKLRTAKNSLTDYPSLYAFCLEHSEVMNVREGESTVSPEDNYVIIAFCRERLAPGSILEMKVTEKDNMLGKQVGKTAYIHDRGWRIMLSGGKFRPGSRSNKFFACVRYKLDPESDADPVMVATFENRKHILGQAQAERAVVLPSAAPAVPQAQAQAPAAQAPAQPAPAQSAPAQSAPARTAPAPKAAAAPPVQAAPPTPAQAAPQMQTAAVAPAALPPAQAAMGPLERGVVFLNPIFPQDVGIIQTRLKQLGFYAGPVDNNLGPDTRKGLDDYAARNGFPKGLWSLDLQKLMFRGTGL